MYTREIIELHDCPEIMQEAVHNYLSTCPEAAVLSAQKKQETPFIEKQLLCPPLKYSLYAEVTLPYTRCLHAPIRITGQIMK